MAFSDLQEAFGGPFPDGKSFQFERKPRADDSKSDTAKADETERGEAEQLGLPGLQHEAKVSAEHGGENVAQAQKYGPLVGEADTAVRKMNEFAERTFGAAEERFSLGLPRVQAVLYSAICDLERRGQADEFLVERRIRSHGNAKNKYTPLVRAFAKRAHPRLRQALSKAAALIALARAESVEPEGFRQWRKAWPIEEACREWRKRQARLERGEDAVDFFLVSDAEFLPPAGPASGYAGRQLAIIECAGDLGGRFRLVRVLPFGEADLGRIVLRAMRRKKGGWPDTSAAEPAETRA